MVLAGNARSGEAVPGTVNPSVVGSKKSPASEDARNSPVYRRLMWEWRGGRDCTVLRSSSATGSEVAGGGGVE